MSFLNKEEKLDSFHFGGFFYFEFQDFKHPSDSRKAGRYGRDKHHDGKGFHLSELCGGWSNYKSRKSENRETTGIESTILCSIFLRR